MATENQNFTSLENLFEKIRESIKELQSSMDEEFNQIVKKFGDIRASNEKSLNMISELKIIQPDHEEIEAATNGSKGNDDQGQVVLDVEKQEVNQIQLQNQLLNLVVKEDGDEEGFKEKIVDLVPLNNQVEELKEQVKGNSLPVSEFFSPFLARNLIVGKICTNQNEFSIVGKGFDEMPRSVLNSGYAEEGYLYVTTTQYQTMYDDSGGKKVDIQVNGWSENDRVIHVLGDKFLKNIIPNGNWNPKIVKKNATITRYMKLSDAIANVGADFVHKNGEEMLYFPMDGSCEQWENAHTLSLFDDIPGQDDVNTSQQTTHILIDDSQYYFPLTTFSPFGRPVQVEYALTAAGICQTPLETKGVNGVSTRAWYILLNYRDPMILSLFDAFHDWKFSYDNLKFHNDIFSENWCFPKSLQRAIYLAELQEWWHIGKLFVKCSASTHVVSFGSPINKLATPEIKNVVLMGLLNVGLSYKTWNTWILCPITSKGLNAGTRRTWSCEIGLKNEIQWVEGSFLTQKQPQSRKFVRNFLHSNTVTPIPYSLNFYELYGFEGLQFVGGWLLLVPWNSTLSDFICNGCTDVVGHLNDNMMVYGVLWLVPVVKIVTILNEDFHVVSEILRGYGLLQLILEGGNVSPSHTVFLILEKSGNVKNKFIPNGLTNREGLHLWVDTTVAGIQRHGQGVITAMFKKGGDQGHMVGYATDEPFEYVQKKLFISGFSQTEDCLCVEACGNVTEQIFLELPKEDQKNMVDGILVQNKITKDGNVYFEVAYKVIDELFKEDCMAYPFVVIKCAITVIQHAYLGSKITSGMSKDELELGRKKLLIFNSGGVMDGFVPEGSQFDARQFAAKMTELLGIDEEEFFTSYNEVYDSFKMCVLHTADEMLSGGFKDQICAIFQLLPPKIQVGVFSASMPPEAFEITRKLMNKLVRILVKHDELTLEGIKQFNVNVDKRQWNHTAWEVVKTDYCGKSNIISFDRTVALKSSVNVPALVSYGCGKMTSTIDNLQVSWMLKFIFDRRVFIFDPGGDLLAAALHGKSIKDLAFAIQGFDMVLFLLFSLFQFLVCDKPHP